MKISWRNVPVDLRSELLRRYDAGEDLQDVANAYGMEIESLKRALRRHRAESPQNAEEASIARNIALATQKVEVFPPTKGPKLTDITHANPQTDQAKWVRFLTGEATAKGLITVMHLCDIHAPFHNKAALGVAYQLVNHVKPDVIVVGSDAADFALLSSFSHDPDMDEDTPDELEAFESFWNTHIWELKKAAPKAKLVYIYGNHEIRIFRYLAENAKKVRRTVLNRFIEIVKCGGAVWYMGHKVDHVRIGKLLVMHGNRYGVNPAKAILQDVGGQVWTIFGHNHKISQHIVAGEDYRVGAFGSGCLSGSPHYANGRLRVKEQLGTAIATVDLAGDFVNIDNLAFNQSWDGNVSVVYERKLFRSGGI